MKVVRAEAMGMCFGVRDALAAAFAEPVPTDTTIHGQLVHNPEVSARLNRLGFRATPEDRREGVPDTDRVLITAHGVSDRERQRLRDAGKELVDTTCPLVTRAHRAAQRLQADGYHVVVIGKPGHVEVVGLVGDLAWFDVVASERDARPIDADRIGVVCQTTVSSSDAGRVIGALRAANPTAEFRVVDTICDPTKARVRAVEELALAVEAVVVIGGRNSNNTRQLVALASSLGPPTYHVESERDLDPSWFADCESVGVTAGTSTLDSTIDAVCAALAAIGADRVSAGP